MIKTISLKMPMLKKQNNYQSLAVVSFLVYLKKSRKLLLSYVTKKEKISPYYYTYKTNLLFS
jgi:hypothetical protein